MIDIKNPGTNAAGKKFAAAILIGLFGQEALGSPTAKRKSYQTKGNCDGEPRLQVSTPPGVCVGLVATGFRFPRSVVPFGDKL